MKKKKGEITECVERLGLDLGDDERLTAEAVGSLLAKEHREEFVNIIEAAYEKGQEDLIRELLNNFDQYTELEDQKIELMGSGPILSWDPEFDAQYLSAINKQEAIQEALQDILGEDTKYIRMKQVIYLKVGSVTQW